MKALVRKIQMLLGRGIVTLTDDSQGIQKVQAKFFAKEVKDKVERIQDYGFTSHPPANSEGIFGFLNGDRSRAFALKVDNRTYRIKNLGQGEVAIYTDEGDKIHFKRGKIIDIETDTLNITATTKVNITSPLVDISDKLHTGDDIDSDKNINATENVSALKNVEATVMVSGPLVQAGTASMSSGAVSDGSTNLADFKAEYENHQHNETGTGGGTTSTPV